MERSPWSLVRDIHEVCGVAVIIHHLALLVGEMYSSLVRRFDISGGKLCSLITASMVVPPERCLARCQKREWTDIIKSHTHLL